MPDTPERAVVIELIDSFESFRLRLKSDCLLLPVDGASDGRRGGRAGDSEGLLGGKIGPWEDCVEVLGGRAGRDMPSMPFAIPFGCPPSGRLLTLALEISAWS